MEKGGVKRARLQRGEKRSEVWEEQGRREAPPHPDHFTAILHLKFHISVNGEIGKQNFNWNYKAWREDEVILYACTGKIMRLGW